MMRDENETLRETITQLQNIFSDGPSASAAASLATIKDKLWEGSLKISPDKKRHINLIRKLTQTKFNPANEKHRALFAKFLQLHSSQPIETISEAEWNLFELGTAGILGLQNLVYFSERYPTLARQMSARHLGEFSQTGVSLTRLLMGILGLQHKEQNAMLPHSTITKTFVRLLDHPKAFEELYCVCFRLYDQAVTSGVAEPLKTVERQISDLLLASPESLQQLIARAEKMIVE